MTIFLLVKSVVVLGTELDRIIPTTKTGVTWLEPMPGGKEPAWKMLTN